MLTSESPRVLMLSANAVASAVDIGRTDPFLVKT